LKSLRADFFQVSKKGAIKMDIPTLANATWQAIQPLLPLLAAKGAEEIGKQAGVSLWEAVSAKFEKKPETKKVAEKLLAEPESAKMQGAFQYHLEELLEEDADFAVELEKLLESAGTTYSAINIGDGAIAQGEGATAVGKGGVYIGGSAKGNTIVTGDGNLVE
jgi:hypothetical protein